MSVKIKNVKLVGCGPIDKFEKEFFPLTIIYSENEKGKTSIIESIIKAVFAKNTRKYKIFNDLRFKD